MSTHHFGQQGAAGVQHERVDEEDLSAVHLDLHVAELRVVHHAAQVSRQPGQRHLATNIPFFFFCPRLQ